MDILNVSIDANKTVGNNLILIGVRPYYRYEDGIVAFLSNLRIWNYESIISGILVPTMYQQQLRIYIP